nr:hypothetical protein BaRGS_003088 [Batillaria attramentaria]
MVWGALTDRVIRLVMIGKTGTGKSETGNSIIGGGKSATGNSIIGSSDAFETYWFMNGTKDCQQKLFYDRHRLSGWFLRKATTGPHAFLMVINLNQRFTDQEYAAYTTLKELFGPEVKNYVIVAFTWADQLETSIENYLRDVPERLKEILSETEKLHERIE